MKKEFPKRLKPIRRAVEHYLGVRPLRESLPELAAISQSPLARTLWQEQRSLLDSMLGCLFGYHLLEMSAFDVDGLSRGSAVNHRFRLAAGSSCTLAPPMGLAIAEALPLPADLIDVVLLHHVLDYSTRPQAVLKEVARVVAPHGNVVIVGFNPFSLMGLCKHTNQVLLRKPFWRRHGLRLGRVVDWLHLLDFEPVEVHQGFYGLPLNQRWVLRQQLAMDKCAQRWSLPCGGFYIIVAKKNVCGMTPAKPKWDPIIPMFGLTKGATRSKVARNHPSTLCRPR